MLRHEEYTSPEALQGHQLYQSKRYQEAEELLKIAVSKMPNDYLSYGRLAKACYHQNKLDLAKKYGRICLKLKMEAAENAYNALDEKNKPVITQINKPFRPYNKKQNIISFSLWGDQDIYCKSAVINAEAATYIYPAWTCRYYYDNTVPQKIINKLKSLGAELVLVEPKNEKWEGLFWRFHVINDLSIDRFICRDCDSVINTQERAAVDAWIESGKPFHIMRDHIKHVDPLLAGMWGGISGVLPPLNNILHPFYLHRPFRGCDQEFLCEIIWPLIKDHAFIHDAYYYPELGNDYPPHGRVIRPEHIGGSWTSLEPLNILFKRLEP